MQIHLILTGRRNLSMRTVRQAPWFVLLVAGRPEVQKHGLAIPSYRGIITKGCARTASVMYRLSDKSYRSSNALWRCDSALFPEIQFIPDLRVFSA
jgi:hypothetical protein